MNIKFLKNRAMQKRLKFLQQRSRTRQDLIAFRPEKIDMGKTMDALIRDAAEMKKIVRSFAEKGSKIWAS